MPFVNMYHIKLIFERAASRSYNCLNGLNNRKIHRKVMPFFQINSCKVGISKIDSECFRKSISRSEDRKYFHTSERRFVYPIMKLIAVITGRDLRRWWRHLPPNRKEYFLARIKQSKNKIIFFALTSVFLSAIYYLSHIEETPITKRKRFIAFNSKQLEEIIRLEFEQLIQQIHTNILPESHPSTVRVKAVLDRILLANWDIEEMKDKNWNVAVIKGSEENAFIFPNGYLFIFEGMLSLCSTDDELGVILSHEVAHCIQKHGVETANLAYLLDWICILIICAICAVIPSDSLSLLTHFVYNKAVNIFCELPYSRKLETEADTVGLTLAAKACFDVRESSAFWAKMAFLEKENMDSPTIEFLSTHPNHETRSEYLDSIVNKAIKYRYESGCPELKSIDPRLHIEIMAKRMEATRQKYFQQYPKSLSRFHF